MFFIKPISILQFLLLLSIFTATFSIIVSLKKIIINHFLEFFFIGFVMGVVEDLIAIALATDAKITPHVIIVAAVVAFPFAVISELVIDYKRLKRARQNWLEKREKENKKS